VGGENWAVGGERDLIVGVTYLSDRDHRKIYARRRSELSSHTRKVRQFMH